VRQLMIQVARGHGAQVLQEAQKFDALNATLLEGRGPDESLDMVLLSVSNARVGPLLDALEALPSLRATFAPQGVLALHPPAHATADQVTDIAVRSPLEIFLSGLQSVGSWKGFLGYAACGAVVVWVGLITQTIYLLTAAMLVAPFAGPAMNAALASARGDAELLGRSLLRYVSSLLVTVGVSALLTWVYGLKTLTPLMLDTSELSNTAAVLPLVAGVAGALSLCQSERSSLVSGAATGILVAASLAPPAGLVGIASVLGQWELVTNAVFVLVLQVVGINLAGALTFRLFGLKSQGPRFERGRRWVVPLSLGVTAAALAGLLVLQLRQPPEFQRSSRATRARAVIQKAVEGSQVASLVDAEVRYAQPQKPSKKTLLGVLYVQRQADSSVSQEEIRSRLKDAVASKLKQEGFKATPLLDITILEPPLQTEGEAGAGTR
jgi:uncharacterized hydrophobic protein (TIGR00271 family)